MPLSDTAVRNFKPRAKPFKLSGGGGLHLLVPTHGSKLWRLACRFGGKQKTLALGIYPGGNVGGSARETGRGKRNCLAPGKTQCAQTGAEEFSRSNV
jgi:hypothetical protein